MIGQATRTLGRLAMLGLLLLAIGLGARPRPAAAELFTVEDVIAYMTPYLDQYWAMETAAWGVAYVSPTGPYFYNTPDNPGPTQSACGELAVNNAFYCWTDWAIYLDYAWLNQQMATFGDFAVAVVLAHEWGHHMENVYGWSSAALYSIQLELYADCLAGAVTADLEWQGALDLDDLTEAYGLAFTISDPIGTDATLPGAHGDVDQRVSAFMGGYLLGSSYDCNLVVDSIAPLG